MHDKVVIATNVSAADAPRVHHSLPSWVRVFGETLKEIVVLVDTQPPSGRIALQQEGAGCVEELYAELHRLASFDRRVRIEYFDAGSGSDTTARKWFGKDKPLRCQAGTPVLAFVEAIERARAGLVLRTDCDMLFCERGWLGVAEKLLEAGEADLVEPPRLGHKPEDGVTPSSRAFLLRPREFAARCLPITAHRVGVLRRAHRVLHRRPTWLALEQMLEQERRRGRIRHTLLQDGAMGFSLHVATRLHASLPWFELVVKAVERGVVPTGQRLHGGDFCPAAWVGQMSGTRDG